MIALQDGNEYRYVKEEIGAEIEYTPWKIALFCYFKFLCVKSHKSMYDYNLKRNICNQFHEGIQKFRLKMDSCP